MWKRSTWGGWDNGLGALAALAAAIFVLSSQEPVGATPTQENAVGSASAAWHGSSTSSLFSLAAFVPDMIEEIDDLLEDLINDMEGNNDDDSEAVRQIALDTRDLVNTKSEGDDFTDVAENVDDMRSILLGMTPTPEILQMLITLDKIDDIILTLSS